MRNWKTITALVLTLVLLVGAIGVPVSAQGVSLSGTVTTGAAGETTLSLIPVGSGEALYTQSVTDGAYSFSNVTAGTYTLKAENSLQVSRSYTVTIGEQNAVQDVQLCTLGDVTLDGSINVGDTARIYAHVCQTLPITDAYALACADVTGDASVDVGDTAKLYAQVRNPQPEVEPEEDYPVPGNPVVDNADAPIELGGKLEFEAPVQAGHLVHYWIYRVSGTTLTINDLNVFAIYNGTTYTPENGVLTIPGLHTDSTQIPVKIAIGNKGITDKTFKVELTYPEGHQMNPYALSSGNLTTNCVEGDSQGVYYSFTAPSSGTLTVRIKGVTGAQSCNVTLISENLIGGTRSESTEDNGTSSVSMTLAEGETVIVNIVVNPENGFNYPAATITTTVRFR